MRVISLLCLFLVVRGSASAGEDKPNKEMAVRVLTDFYRSLEKKDYKKALDYLVLPKEAKGKENLVMQGLEKLAGSSELSLKGIEILGEKGRWDLLEKHQGKKEAKRMSQGLPPEKLFGLFVSPRRGAAFYWDGKTLRITYFNNIGRIEMEP